MVDLQSLQVGDKVQIIPDLQLPVPGVRIYKVPVGARMVSLAGQTVTIDRIYRAGVRLYAEVKENEFVWSEDILNDIQTVSLMNLLTEC